MQRKDEILAKKARLAELRRQRDEREQRNKESGKRDLTVGESSEVKVSTPPRVSDKKELDSYIETLVGNKSRDVNAGTSSPVGKKSRPSSAFGTENIGTERYDGPSSQLHPAVAYASASTQTSSTAAVETTYEQTPAVTSTPTAEVLTYSKGVQTSDLWSPQEQRRLSDGLLDSDADLSPSAPQSPSKRRNRREQEKEEELRESLRREIEEELKAAKGLNLDGPTPTGPSKFPARALTDEEVNAVTASEDFLEFVERSSKVIEKALDQDYDILADYAQDGTEVESDEDEGYGSSRGKKGRRVRQIAQFYDERWSKKRMISDVNFSPKFPELLLASYTKNPSAPQDSSGLVQIWNMHLHSRPEYTFHSTSDILTAKFSPFHPSIIIGGSYSGHVLLWDTRSKSALPVDKTPLTAASNGGHTHPIYSISVVGTQNANNIISCSTDGVVCGWAVDRLSKPEENLELKAPPPSKTEDLSPTCMSFPISDPTSFLVGTEEGTIYPCHRYDRAGAKAGVDPRLRYKGHTAPVMSLDFHPARGPVDLGDLILSSSLDWTVKLWKTRTPSSTSAATSNASSVLNPDEHAVGPLLEISREDIVYDARWSPLKPGVFSSVDGAGNVEVWDLTIDTEVPAARVTPEMNRNIQGGYAPKSLEKVCWEEKEGKRLGVGGAAGVVTVFEVGADLAGESVRNEEWTRMKRLIGKIEAER